MIYVSEHAILRYQERVKPTHNFPRAKHELEILVRMAGEVKPGHPDWFPPSTSNGEGWLDISDGIAGIVAERVVTTVVVRSGSHPDARAAKAAVKRKRKAKRNWHNKLAGKGRHRRGAAPEWG